ncbi:MAG: hypothetical protein ACJ8AK_06495 [Gemmatimonadaceae bacterium]
MNCWASRLGGCGGKISREHLVTEAFWRTNKISVVGFPWCKTTPKEVGTAAIVSKFLCRDHNSALSPVDEAGARAFEEFEAAEKLTESRRRLGSRQWFLHCFGVDASLLERWFLKTAINLALVNDWNIQWALGNDGDRPPRSLVAAAFGQAPIVRPMGLYSAASVGDTIKPLSGLVFMPLIWEGHGLAGGLFEWRGYKFFFNLVDSPLPQVLPTMPGGVEVWAGATLSYHPNRINHVVINSPSHFIDFHWPDSTLPHFAT